MHDPRHILLVEDEDNIAIAVGLLLEREGYRVTRTAIGSQALPNLRAITPDLVILDVTLPEMSGYEICQQLRRDPELGQTPVLMMSARTAPAERRKAMALGADAFLAKPFAVQDLITAVTRLSQGTQP
ncbi:response regulator transcription factor [Celeribacter sp.]|uniref:response regulator transcription factor n=1 Tax=Celeribacter sp. TaxID=1890673 RepID=UPI003A922EB8